ncbi:MAG: DUF4919 domain-containing protein [Chlorobi bacterium]|nr:DUF4919 domain-containing protein [Chlorobiota bacterium]
MLRLIFLTLFVLVIGACKTASEGTNREIEEAFIKKLMIPNYDTIEVWIHSKRNRNQYNKWLERLLEYDTSLTLSELHKLYYGWIYYRKYNPYNQEVKRIFSEARIKIASSQTGEVELIETMEQVQKALQLDPFCLPCHYLNFMGFHIMGKEEQAKRVQRMIDKIALVIRFSGMGTEDQPLRVVSPQHADGFLFISGLKAKKKKIEVVQDSIYLYIVYFEKQKDSNIKKVVFDITPAVQWQHRQQNKQSDNNNTNQGKRVSKGR